jgi:hypothetical protein
VIILDEIGKEDLPQASRYKRQKEVDMSLKKGIVIGIVAIVLYGIVGLPLVAEAQETYGSQLMNKPAGTEIVFDFIIARPLGIASLAMGSTLFIVSFPLAVLTGSTGDTAHALVAEPFNFTFVRGLGEY